MKIHSTDYFINESTNNYNLGYWEPHSSSIDFCETNYLLSHHIVEVHNTLSSLWGLVLVGLIGLVYGNPTKERRFAVAYGMLIVTGLGSTALHATLHWVFQSSDELPMMFFELAVIYCLVEVKSPRNAIQYPRLPLYFFLLAVIDTVVYFQFQQIYIIFLSSFIGIMIAALSLHGRLAWEHWKTRKEKHNSRIALRVYYWHYLSFLVVAVPVWMVDQLACSSLLEFYNQALPWPLQGCTAHVLWHAMAGMAAHFIIQFVVACRLDCLNLSCDIQWVAGGIIPVVVSTTTTSSAGMKTKRN
mmetsp:Transcript_26738/g.39548  ORF Transcript_26738/g.39548 Transcript_26738/m.39548 type:complete len:300 (+) Transcript_26738:216-1115(+)|eukprot:CAMPEP_0194222774 /NCGR_PEP_ID=MMETSP0156-20130528/33742_1 /TAXON_ID=33649 /ORGANISM="Thalassionema nitzschioides, Strain L26-B" /LENGTH=299 /DNA_ID=CAMNT_0038953701 /DNA_START=129 /DNA_END=1028 /DNA_ORIENTATION=-